MSGWRLEWPWPDGAPDASARLKACPEDFRVTELLYLPVPVLDLPEELPESIAVPGQGEHLLIYLEKTGDNTAWVAQRLGQMSGCGERGVGHSGRKDRHAVTRQWFSVQRPGQEQDDAGFIHRLRQHWTILSAARHSRKLRTGEHRANRFHIRLRELSGDPQALDARLQAVQEQGCPNYVGPQRFGHQGGNLDRAVAMTSRPGRRRRGRRGGGNPEGLYLSAARSWLFNEVLAERVVQGNWRTLLDGEPGVEPTGPLWGDGGTVATDTQEALERGVVARHPDVAAVFADTRMAPERRPLVLVPAELTWSFPETGGGRWLDLSFTLPPGQYATTVLAAVVSVYETTAQ